MKRDLTRHAFCIIMLLAFSLVVAAAGDASAETVWYVDDDATNDPGPGGGGLRCSASTGLARNNTIADNDADVPD